MTRPTSPTDFDHGTRGKRPRFRAGDRVSLASHVRPIPAYGGKPFVGREDVLRVSSVVGKGSQRDPWGINVTDDAGHFWNLMPGDLVNADESPKRHATMRDGNYSIVSFSDDPVTYWTGTGWRKGLGNALKIDSKSDAIAIWRSLAVDKKRDVWLVKDWGDISEETIATSEDGIF